MLETGLYRFADVTWSNDISNICHLCFRLSYSALFGSMAREEHPTSRQLAPFRGMNSACRYDRTSEAKALTAIAMLVGTEC